MALENKESSKKAIDAEPRSVSPTQLGPLVKATWAARRVPFIWGPPGIGKSEILQQQATAMGVAYIDVRLASKNPSQIAGVPFPVESHGEMLVRYSIPAEFPRDLDVDAIVDVYARKKIKFDVLNPKGVNGIHYCQHPTIVASSLNPNLIATIVEQDHDYFVVTLTDSEGNAAKGDIHYTIIGKCRAVICFDELSSANQSVQAVAYSLINDRRLGEYIFPEGVMVAAAGNREKDRGATYALVAPLKNRFQHYYLKENLADWLLHAKMAAAYPLIIKYHETTEGKHLMKFNPNSAEDAWASPRTWIMLSDIEYQLDKAGITDDDMRMIAVAGIIGNVEAFTYMNFKKKFADYPEPKDVLSGSAGKPPRRLEPAGQMFLATTIIWALRLRLKTLMKGNDHRRNEVMRSERADDYYRDANNAFRYMKENFAPDILASMVKQMSMTYKLPLDPARMPDFKLHLQNDSNIVIR